MLKTRLKVNDTFVVTVEIFSANAIIVSAKIDNIIFRGALIESYTNESCLFKNQDDSKYSFSSKRFCVRDAKRNIRLKTFKSNYKLRQNKRKTITPVNQDQKKNDDNIYLKEVIEEEPQNIIETKPLSIVLTRLSDTYLEEGGFQEEEQERNVLKISRVKVKCDEYMYFVSSKDSPEEVEEEEALLPPSTIASLTVPKKVSPPSLPTTLSFSECKDFASSSNSDVTKTCSSLNTHGNNGFKIKIIKRATNSYSIKDGPIPDMSRYNSKRFHKDDVIWAKMDGRCVWPAQVLDIGPNDQVLLLWFGTRHHTSTLHRRKLWHFGAHFQEKFNQKGRGVYLDAVQQAQACYQKAGSREMAPWHRSDLSSESSTLLEDSDDNDSHTYLHQSDPESGGTPSSGPF